MLCLHFQSHRYPDTYARNSLPACELPESMQAHCAGLGPRTSKRTRAVLNSSRLARAGEKRPGQHALSAVLVGKLGPSFVGGGGKLKSSLTNFRSNFGRTCMKVRQVPGDFSALILCQEGRLVLKRVSGKLGPMSSEAWAHTQAPAPIEVEDEC